MVNQNRHIGGAFLSILNRFISSLFHAFFRFLYHQFAWTYDWVANIVSVGQWQRWVLNILPYVNGDKVLEIGFGTGHLQAAISQNGIGVFGLDESDQMVNITRQRLVGMNLPHHLTRGVAQNLPFADHSIHQVLMTFPAEFLLLESTFAEIHRVLVPGGSLVILPLAWVTGRSPCERLVAWLNRVTGEAPEWNEKLLEPFIKPGFSISWKIIPLHSSRLLLIQLIKLPSESMDC